jgi:hypothetical protein
MRHLIVTASLTAFLLQAGCLPVQSLHPLYTEKDIVSEAAIVGAWFDSEDEDSRSELTFADLGNLSYRMGITNPDKSTELKFVAHLVRLGNALFLDARLDDFRVKGDDQGVLVFAAPVHTIYRVKIAGDSLHLVGLDDDWLKKSLANRTVKIAHEDLDNGSILLTATPVELQGLVTAHADDKNAFIGDTSFTRRKP